MNDEQKPDPSLLKLAVYHRKATSLEYNRTLNFEEWMNKRTTSRARHSSRKVQSSVALPTLPSSSPKTQTAGQLMIKDEPWQGPTELAYDEPLISAAQDWIAPTKDSSNKIQTHSPPNEVKLELPFSSGNPNLHTEAPSLRPSCPQPNPTPMTSAACLQLPNPSPNQDQGLKLLPKTSIPTRPHSFLKRKATDIEQPQKHDTPSPYTSMMKKSADNLLCHLCHVSCSGAISMQQHLRGRPHKAKMKYMKMKRDSTTTATATTSPRCDLCEIWCPDLASLQMHFKGKKHKSKLQECSYANREAGRNLRKRLLSVSVQCSLHEPRSFESHLKGRQHAAKQELERRGFH